MYPKIFQPSETEPFLFNNETIEIPKCIVQFEKWNGEPIKETFGGKGLISVDNKPMFAELAIMIHFIKEGWQARWIETYGKSNKSPIHLTEWKDVKYINQTHDPIEDKEIIKLLAGIATSNGDSYAGCWDVIGWKDDRVVFVEAKRTKQDKIRSTQAKWLTAGLNYGLNNDNFLIAQWDM